MLTSVKKLWYLLLILKKINKQYANFLRLFPKANNDKYLKKHKKT